MSAGSTEAAYVGAAGGPISPFAVGRLDGIGGG